jgi:hypothetical protein
MRRRRLPQQSLASDVPGTFDRAGDRPRRTIGGSIHRGVQVGVRVLDEDAPGRAKPDLDPAGLVLSAAGPVEIDDMEGRAEDSTRVPPQAELEASLDVGSHGLVDFGLLAPDMGLHS